MATKKAPTLAQARSIYEAGRRAYASSNIMLVDDIFRGMKPAARRARVTVYTDVQWFQLMARYIRAHKPWQRLTDEQRRDIHEALKG